MNWGLPESVEVQGVTYPICTDYRCILDIMTDLANPEEDERGRAMAVLIGLYPDFDDMPPEHYEDALKMGMWFINGGEEKTPEKKPLRLVDWEQDFPYIVAPINRAIGRDIRAEKHMHWWTFLAAYREIGDCTFAQVVRIRDHKARGKALDKIDQEFYRRNRQMVDLKTKYTPQEDAVLDKWLR